MTGGTHFPGHNRNREADRRVDRASTRVHPSGPEDPKCSDSCSGAFSSCSAGPWPSCSWCFYPLLWLLLLPLRLLGIAVSGVLELFKAVIFLPARLLGARPR